MSPISFFNMLSDTTRLRCLVLLSLFGELCVCELTETLQLSQPKISRHLALLRQNHIAQSRRNGLWIFYKINPDLSPWLQDILKSTVQNCRHLEPYQHDIDRYQKNRIQEPVPQCRTEKTIQN